MGYHLRTRVDLLQPDIRKKVFTEQSKQKQIHDECCRDRHFNEGDGVWITDFCSYTNKWEPGILVERVGPVSFKVKLMDGQTFERHLDHLHHRSDSPNSKEPQVLINDKATTESLWDTHPVQLSAMSSAPTSEQLPTIDSNSSVTSHHIVPVPLRQNPPWNRRPPNRFLG